MKRGVIFLLILATLVISLGGGIFVRGIKADSIIENRTLASFPSLSLASFINTEYQTNLEQALSDQLVLGQTLKNMYNKIKNTNTRLVVAKLKDIDKIQEKTPSLQRTDKANNPSEIIDKFPVSLTPRGGELMELDDSHHLVFHRYPLEYADEYLQRKANNINDLADNYPGINFSCFYIETDVDVDFINKQNNHELANSLASHLDTPVKFDKLAIDNLTNFQQRFYKTDHHWNDVGQFEGYKKIINLLKGSNENLFATENISIDDLKFNGYKSRQLDDYSIYDNFGVLKETVPEHQIYINHKLGRYGTKETYLKGNYSIERGFNHYGVCNGGDYGLIEFKFNQPEKENIVIFAESFSNPINKLIAAHYDNTYIIDLRYYERDCGQPFNFGSFIENKNISQVLFLGYAYFYANDVFLIND